MHKNKWKKFLFFEKDFYIDFEKRVFISLSGEKEIREEKIKGKKDLNCLQFLVSVPHSTRISVGEIYKSVWEQDFDFDSDNCRHYVCNAISRIRMQLRKLYPPIKEKDIIKCQDGQYYFIMPKDAFVADSVRNPQHIRSEAPLKASVEYNYLKHGQLGIPVTVNLYYEHDSTLENIEITVKLSGKENCIINDTIGFIPPREIYQYVIGYLNENVIRFLSKEQITLKRIDDNSNFEIEIKDNKVQITCNLN